MRKLYGMALAAATLAVFSAPYTVPAVALGDDDRPVPEEKPDQKTLNRLAEAVEKNPNDVSARCELGACYDQLALPDLAREQYAAAIKAAPNNPHLWMLRVKQELKSGRSEVAMHLIESAHERFADDPEVLFWYGNYFAAKSRIDDAAFAYNLALKKNPEIEGLRSALGEVCLDRMRYGDALNLANDEIKSHPQFWLAYKVKAFALMGLHKPDEALPPLRVAYANYPTKAIVARTYARACIWCGLYKEGLTPALMYLNSTSNLTSNDPVAKKMAGTILEHLPKEYVEKELPKLVESIQKIKPNAAFYFALGDTLDRVDLNDLAVGQFYSGLRAEPGFARGLFRLGRDFEIARRDYKAALMLYSQASVMAPDDQEIATYFARLGRRYKNRENDLAWRLKDAMLPAIPSVIPFEVKVNAK
ncbi:MAG: tetratricopeptide repeat protein [Cyanobacteria bacterium SZAS-4]|nr:tetratricopeptide repeat protein [Cyanobacteria bacterium SZAS-4]